MDITQKFIPLGYPVHPSNGTIRRKLSGYYISMGVLPDAYANIEERVK